MNVKLNDSLLSALNGKKAESFNTRAIFKVSRRKQILVLIRKKNPNLYPDTEGSTSYKYKYNHKEWNKTIATYTDYFKEMSEHNETLIHEYENGSVAAIRQHAQILSSKILNFASKYRIYETIIHFIGLGQGGNIAFECTHQLNEDNTFFINNKCYVGSVITVATPLYKELFSIEGKALKEKGITISFGNRNDFTQQALAYFNPDNKILESVSGLKNTKLPVATKNIKLQYAKLLSELLLKPQTASSLSDYTIEQTCLNILNDLSNQLQAVALLRFDAIQLKEIIPFDGLITVIENTKNNLNPHLKTIAAQLKSQDSISKNDILQILNVFCKVVDAFTALITTLLESNQATKIIAERLTAHWGIKQIDSPAEANFIDLGIEPIIDVEKQKALIDKGELKDDFEFDMAGIMANKVKSLLAEATVSTNKVADMTDFEKVKLGEALFVLLRPLYKNIADEISQLFQAVPFDLSIFTKNLAQEENTKRLYIYLNEANLNYPVQLQASFGKLREKAEQINILLKETSYTFLQQDFRHYIFGSHNLALEKCYGFIGQAISEATGITTHMTGKGYKGIARPDSYDFDLIGSSEIPNTLSTQRIKGEII